MDLKESIPTEGKTLASVYFFMQGLAILLPYSAIISTFDFYDVRYPSANVSFTFPLANFASNVILILAMVYIKKNTTLNFRVPICSAITILLLIGMPIVALILPNSLVGLWLLNAFQFISGATSTVTNATVVGIAGHFPSWCMANNSLGSSVSGLLGNVLRAVVLVFYPRPATESSIRTEIFIYYGIATLFLVFCILIHYQFINSRFTAAFLPEESPTETVHPLDASEPKDAILLNDDQNKVVYPSSTWEKAKDNFKELFRVLMQTKNLNFVMFLCHAQTLMLAPGVLLMKPIDYMDAAWKIVSLLALFNFFDAIGKTFTFINFKYGQAFITILVYLRFFFYYVFIIQALGQKDNFFGEDWVGFVNIGLFGLTNGYITSAVFILCPSQVQGKDKEIVGYVALLSLLVGITVGSIGALPFRNLRQ